MAKLTIDDLKKIKEKSNKETSLRHGDASIKVTVHMGTCGIAAGAREVMNALMEEMAEADRQDIRVVTSGCMGMCSSEVSLFDFSFIFLRSSIVSFAIVIPPCFGLVLIQF